MSKLFHIFKGAAKESYGPLTTDYGPMWLVGIDEAGYGPNLGPLVMTSVACRVPKARAGVDLWKVLRRAVRRHGEEDDGRLLVADSKQVYSPARGLEPLERGALGTVGRRGA